MGTRPVILCIDDNELAVTVRKLVLEQAGYEVIVALTGEEGLRLVGTRHVDLVLSDHFLQGRTGTEIAGEIKAMRPNLPILLISGMVEPPEDADHVDGFVSKIDGREALLREIQRLLNKRISDAA